MGQLLRSPMIAAVEHGIVAHLIAAILREQLNPQPDLSPLYLGIGRDRRVAACPKGGGEGSLGQFASLLQSEGGLSGVLGGLKKFF